ncbi:integral to membrane protein [Coprinopsis cinerea okayama7|uniref:Integral to membrane protein n=1 Tax=Coprinopsis cinerea (strain Okayama-7 / 130 / ATCC MYA-4618 / FGSC 9003) TaxID=240176 RepID=A8N7D4_COPC7|nr:integral to membrane protein [Coprinopsis cinerea okayama7\|eukprot:XP_001830740.2 integral to membrane protein [Coprinopsis cinerea okayama7\
MKTHYHFEVAYFPGNQSVSFNLSAASVQSNVNVTANLFLNVYGMNPVNVTLDLCSIFNGDLCPLPAYNFTGADSIVLPNSLNVADMIPLIAYKIPDLEGFAQLTLTEPSTGIVRACVQATLSNGWSAHQSAVEWGTGGAAIATLIVSVFLTLFTTDAIAPFRFLELMYLFQSIASSALLSLNYPSVYRAFALNFAWAVGLFPTSDSSAIQNSINELRHRTGSQLADSSSGSVVQFVNRRLSPYNNEVTTSSSSAGISSIFRRDNDDLSWMGNGMVSALTKRAETLNGQVETVTPDSDNVLDAGLPIYVNSLHVSTANAFMTAFLCALMLFGVTLALLGIGYGVNVLLRRFKEKKLGRTPESGFDYIAFARSWILRISLISFGPLLLFIFYQWTLKDSWATVLLSVLCFLAIGALVGYPTFLVVRLVRQNDQFALYTPGNSCLAANGPLYSQYRPPRSYFFAPLLAATVLRSIIVAFAKYTAQAQVGLLIATEVILVGLHCWLRPYQSRGGDIFSTYLAIVRLVTSGLLIAFLQPLEVKPIPRVVIGIVIAVIFSVAVVITLTSFILNLGLQRLWSKRTSTGSSSSTGSDDSASQGSMLEKGVVVAESNPALDSTARSRTNNAHASDSSDDSGSDEEMIVSANGGGSSVGHGYGQGRESVLSMSRPPTSMESYHASASSSPSAWRPGSSSGSSSGNVTRQSSAKAVQHYQQQHRNIPENETTS